ncbi:pyruvate, water dikinase regulatory protein [Propionibacterium australiense]|uniref:Putative pyruvate, phosphate dikinase regulatory protein n=1 Tax=Propionibacterium australiense TaxID=119981 RepID=A0A383S9T7_9ACTN|nr:pyruvate, water dikinase regulatory protein [Propionibacterium australiense]RLP07155.1 pyruvate, phosphate dikinase/phosphoenolpyruvate synthase regulator [Propionibacterium australiense]RLP07557.1 pyruvate, phosphate dikinase/phosphoenolpyruvate synthase regulator [Propionibacterium australiense]SYZ34129.1 [pyruvate, phosphate dikinase] kinase/[pyruvate, phosphate dikinase]-phosphate phosphotransferase [Propionibacterium australiense]VEH92642.1 Putative phosphotransferase yqfL [Propionibact
MSPSLEIHVIADSSGETAARLARAARMQFPDHEFQIVRHSRVHNAEQMLEVFDAISASADPERGQAGRAIFYTLVNGELRGMVARFCNDKSIPCADLMGDALSALSEAAGADADEVPMRPVGVEADYFDRISAMEFAVRNDDGVMPDSLRECDICLVGASRSGKTPLSIYLGYAGYKTVNVPIVPGIAPPPQLRAIDRWRIVGLTIDAERLLQIRTRRVKGLGGFGQKDGYSDLLSIYDELDEVGQVQRSLGCPVIDTTGLALEEAAARVIEIVEERARRAGAHLRRPAGSMKLAP